MLKVEKKSQKISVNHNRQWHLLDSIFFQVYGRNNQCSWYSGKVKVKHQISWLSLFEIFDSSSWCVGTLVKKFAKHQKAQTAGFFILNQSYKNLVKQIILIIKRTQRYLISFFIRLNVCSSVHTRVLWLINSKNHDRVSTFLASPGYFKD